MFYSDAPCVECGFRPSQHSATVHGYPVCPTGTIEAAANAAKLGLDPVPFARTYDCESPDGEDDTVYVVCAVSRRDVQLIRDLAVRSAIITGEVTIEPRGSAIAIGLDNYTAFA